MTRKIGAVSLVVRDYDEAIAWYVRCLDFVVVDDADLGGGKRWVLVAPARDAATPLLLAQAATPQQRAHMGDQTGGRVFLFLYTDDFWRDYEAYKSRGIEFVREPSEAPHGTVAVFKDLYGSMWDLVQLRTSVPFSAPV